MLGRVNYYTQQHGGGALYERRAALEQDRRRRILAPLDFQREVCIMLSKLNDTPNWRETCVPNLELIADICRAERGPDYLVFPFALAQGVVESWATAVPGAQSKAYYLHDCAELR
jgi:hypothetical protein